MYTILNDMNLFKFRRFTSVLYVLKCRLHKECLKLSSDLPLRCRSFVEIEILSLETVLHVKWCERKDVRTFLTGGQQREFQVSFGRALETIATPKLAKFIEATR